MEDTEKEEKKKTNTEKFEEALKKADDSKKEFDKVMSVRIAPANRNVDANSQDTRKNKKVKSHAKVVKKKRHGIIIFPIVVIILLVGIYFLDQKYDLKSYVELNYVKSGLEIEKVSLEDNKVSLTFSNPKIWKKRWYKVMSENEDITDWIEVSDENKIDANEKIKYIKIKDEKNESEKLDITNYLNVIYEINVKTTLNKIMLTKGESKELEIETKYIGNPSNDINISSSDSSIISVNNKTITALEAGKVDLTVSDNYGHKVEIPVTSTDLIYLPQIIENKPFLHRGYAYTEEEAHLLDELLDYKVKEAGEGTRAAVVAVCKFITMEFPYRLPYFFENGRYQKNEYSQPCDGEGRYYHKGLYLSEDKYAGIKDSRAGPAMWGAPLYELSTKTTQHNGLDCSGFVSWALYNAGFDPGDIGAGPDPYFATIPGYGVEYTLTMDILRSGIIKDGDVITWWGHVALIEDIDLENETITISDTVFRSVGLTSHTHSFYDVVNNELFSMVYDMSEFYGEKD